MGFFKRGESEESARVFIRLRMSLEPERKMLTVSRSGERDWRKFSEGEKPQ